MNVNSRYYLKVRLIELNMSQIDLAHKVGITESYLSKIANGHIVPSAKMMEKIADALSTTVEEIFI